MKVLFYLRSPGMGQRPVQSAPPDWVGWPGRYWAIPRCRALRAPWAAPGTETPRIRLGATAPHQCRGKRPPETARPDAVDPSQAC